MQLFDSLAALGLLIAVQIGYVAATPTILGLTCGPLENVPVNNFSYTPSNGPLNWHETVPNSQLCKTGRNQTPILLDSTISQTSPGALVYTPGNQEEPLLFENLGTTVEVRNAKVTLQALGTQYTMQNYHFHTPSEHRINLEYSPVELHMVFRNANGGFLVIGINIELVPLPAIFSGFVQSALSRVSCIATPGTAVEIPTPPFQEIATYVRNNRFYQYDGSLTTPPCSEGLKWFVGAEKLKLDVGTFNELKRVVKFNSRFTQSRPGQVNVLEDACT
jgi:carbonic anhydrase